jgi:hypothetical protein
VILAFASAVGALASGGCSESESRQASERLREATAAARRSYDEAAELLSRPTGRTEEQKQFAEEKLAASAEQALLDWINAFKGRDLVLVDSQRFAGAWEQWERCRGKMVELKPYRHQLDNVPAKLANDILEYRKSDLPPLVPEEIAKMAPRDWRNEARKVKIVQRLEDDDKRRRVFQGVLDELAAEAFAAWVNAEPSRGAFLTAGPDKAHEMLADWISDEDTLNDIVSTPTGTDAVGMSGEVKPAVKERLRMPAVRDAVARRLRGGQPPALRDRGAPAEQAITLATDARRALQAAIGANAQADQADRDNAVRLLAQIIELQGGWHDRLVQSAAAELFDATDLAAGDVEAVNAQLDRLAHLDKLLAPREAELTAAKEKAERAVEAAKKKMEDLEAAIAGKVKRRDALRTTARETAVKANQAYQESLVSGDHKVREQKLAAYDSLQKQANAAERESEELDNEIRGLRIDLKADTRDFEESSEKLEIAKADLEQYKARRAANAAQRNDVLVALARKRRSLDAVVERIVGVKAPADEHRRRAGELFREAGEQFKRLERAGTADQARMLLRRADLFRRHRQLHTRMARTAGEMLRVMSRAEAQAAGITPELAAASARPLVAAIAGQDVPPDADLEEPLAASSAELEKRRKTVEARCQDAAALCDEALRRGDDAAALPLREMLAAAYTARMSIAEAPNQVKSEALSSALGEMLGTQPPEYPEAQPMHSVRELRALLGLKVEREAVEPTAPPPTTTAPATP